MPSSWYAGGSKKFRVFMQVGDKKDRAVSFKSRSEEEAWGMCCQLLEDHAAELPKAEDVS